MSDDVAAPPFEMPAMPDLPDFDELKKELAASVGQLVTVLFGLVARFLPEEDLKAIRDKIDETLAGMESPPAEV